jgi:hypothetical protein
MSAEREDSSTGVSAQLPVTVREVFASERVTSLLEVRSAQSTPVKVVAAVVEAGRGGLDVGRTEAPLVRRWQLAIAR